MKLRLTSLLFVGIIIQIFATQGMLNFYVLNLLGNWEYKSLIHPLSFFLILFVFFIKSYEKLKITPIESLFLIYFALVFLFLIFNVTDFSSGYLAFRDVFLLFIMIFIYNKTWLKAEQLNKILWLLHIFIIANIFFVILTYVLNPIEYMKMMTGRFVWGVDPEYKFKISNFFGTSFWRSPGLIGSAGSVAYFSAFTYILMDGNTNFKRKKYLALILTAFCFIRSAYLLLGLYIVLKFCIQKKNLKKIFLVFKYAIPFFIFGIIYLSKHRIFSLESFRMRLDFWENAIDVPYNFFYGGAIGKTGAAVRELGFAAVLDSYWLLMLYSTGIIGIILVFLFFYEKTLHNTKLIILSIALALSGFFVTLTQAIPILVLFPLFFIKRVE